MSDLGQSNVAPLDSYASSSLRLKDHNSDQAIEWLEASQRRVVQEAAHTAGFAIDNVNVRETDQFSAKLAEIVFTSKLDRETRQSLLEVCENLKFTNLTYTLISEDEGGKLIFF